MRVKLTSQAFINTVTAEIALLKSVQKFGDSAIHQGLNFRVGWQDLYPKFRNPV